MKLKLIQKRMIIPINETVKLCSIVKMIMINYYKKIEIYLTIQIKKNKIVWFYKMKGKFYI